MTTSLVHFTSLVEASPYIGRDARAISHTRRFFAHAPKACPPTLMTNALRESPPSHPLFENRPEADELRSPALLITAAGQQAPQEPKALLRAAILACPWPARAPSGFATESEARLPQQGRLALRRQMARQSCWRLVPEASQAAQGISAAPSPSAMAELVGKAALASP